MKEGTGAVLLVAAVAFASGLLVNLGLNRPAAPAPTPAVIETREWRCTAVNLDGAWQWPPICDRRPTSAPSPTP